MNGPMIIFTLFYAIMFGGVINRLGVWSAFARDNRRELCATVFARVVLSWLLLHVLPAIYFALVFWFFQHNKTPTIFYNLIGCSVGIFLSVLFIPFSYRIWSAIVLHCELHPKARKELCDKINLGWESHAWSALPPLLLTLVGLLLWYSCS